MVGPARSAPGTALIHSRAPGRGRTGRSFRPAPSSAFLVLRARAVAATGWRRFPGRPRRCGRPGAELPEVPLLSLKLFLAEDALVAELCKFPDLIRCIERRRHCCP